MYRQLKVVTMKCTITLFAFMFFSLSFLGCISHNGENVLESDSTAIHRRVAELRDLLNNRNFSEDMATLRVKVEQLGNKTKAVIEGHTTVVKELI